MLYFLSRRLAVNQNVSLLERCEVGHEHGHRFVQRTHVWDHTSTETSDERVMCTSSSFQDAVYLWSNQSEDATHRAKYDMKILGLYGYALIIIILIYPSKPDWVKNCITHVPYIMVLNTAYLISVIFRLTMLLGVFAIERISVYSRTPVERPPSRATIPLIRPHFV